MSKTALELRNQAENEFYEIVDYYKEIDPALADDFIKEFEKSLQEILDFPKAGHPYFYETKRVFLNHFPYLIVYKIYKDQLIMVYAVLHMKRKPGYWKERLK